MTSKGVGFACKIEGTMNAELYTSILDDELQQTIQYCQLDSDQIIFQQDNDPKHTSKLAQEWFKDNEIEVLQWPPQSPDLNPIEHLWRHLKFQVANHEKYPKSIADLWERVEGEWNAIPLKVCL